MNPEAFEQRVRSELESHRKRFPAMQPQDAVKFVFQALLGVGHLLDERDAVADYIDREMRALTPDPGEPLFERLSPAWCRLNLRRAAAEGLTPDMIAGMMLVSSCAPPFAREDVLRLCETLVPGADELGKIADEAWLPSHSPAYRAAYHPAYRVVSADWMALAEALPAIARAQAGTDRLLVTLDGPCASGKTTLARSLAQMLRAPVVHTDEFVIPHARKSPERLAIPGGNCDAERLAAEVLSPWKRGEPVRFRRYDCRADAMLLAESMPPARALILEGSYCNVPALRAFADVRLFLDVPWPVREARLRARETSGYLQSFYDRWIPLENAYFTAYGLPDAGCAVIRLPET